MKHKWPMIGPFTSLGHDLKQIFESHGIDITAYEVQPRHQDSGADALWTIEGRHIGLKEQREDLIDDDGQKFAVITFPVDSHEEFEQQRQENKMEDESWYYVNNQRDVVSELDSPIQRLQKLASKGEKQSAEEAADIVKQALEELQEIRKRNQLYREQPDGKSTEPVSGSKLLSQAETGEDGAENQ